MVTGVEALYDRLDTMEVLHFLKPAHKRRVTACLFACAFITTEDLERIAALDPKKRHREVVRRR